MGVVVVGFALLQLEGGLVGVLAKCSLPVANFKLSAGRASAVNKSVVPSHGGW